MPLVTVVTRDVAGRYRGFLASVMLEIAPGVYISPQMNAGVRSRMWSAISDWYAAEPNGSVVMVWQDGAEVGGIGILALGTPPKELVDLDGLWVTRRKLPVAL